MTTTILLKDYTDNEIYNIITFNRYLNDEDVEDIQDIIDNANNYFTEHCDAYGFLNGMYQTEWVLNELAMSYDFDETPIDMTKTIYV